MPNAKLKGKEGKMAALDAKLKEALEERGVDEGKIAETVTEVGEQRTPIQGAVSGGKLYKGRKMPPLHKLYYDALVAKLGKFGKGSLSTGNLSEELGISATGKAGIIKALVANGYITAKVSKQRLLGTYIEILK